MASNPGMLTDWPWKSLGSFKYVALIPMAAHSMLKGIEGRDLALFTIFPFMLLRMLHSQIWISYSRYQTTKGKRRIVDKGLEFEQIDRESNWDDQMILTGIIIYVIRLTYPGLAHLPLWRADGIILTILLHAGPVEFLYYWLHRALHHHYLYSRYHSHHHSSIVTQPITAVIHPFAEIVAYFFLFAIPMLTTLFTGSVSVISYSAYILYIDFMNNLGHCNLELIPSFLFSAFPPLKYLMYTPSFHSLHHTQFRTNYSLFMPIYDYIYGTVDNSSDVLYEKILKKPQEVPNVVYLTHLTKADSFYHRSIGFAAWLFSHKFFIGERIKVNNVKSQTWVIPRYNIQYPAMSDLIGEAIMEAEDKGVKVLSLDLHYYGDLQIIKRNPQLRLKIVDGSSLVVAIVLHTIPPGTTQVLLGGNLDKVAFAIASALSKRAVRVGVVHGQDYEHLSLHIKDSTNLMLTKNYDEKIWLVGDGLTEKDQLKASPGTLFIPFAQSPLRMARKDCLYHNIPAMIAPKSIENLNSCENWLPRRVMNAWRIAGILHAMEEWDFNEYGDIMFDIQKVWQTSLLHGFRPFTAVK